MNPYYSDENESSNVFLDTILEAEKNKSSQKEDKNYSQSIHEKWKKF